MQSSPSRAQKLATGVGAIALFLIAVLGILGLGVLVIWPWWIVAAIAAIALVLALPIFYVRKVAVRGREGWSPIRSYAAIALVTFAMLSAVVAFPAYYFAYIVDARPALVPSARLTNGKKIVQLQGMQHIGSEGFYKAVVYDLREALDNGYRLYYEGVQPAKDRPDLTAWFNALATSGAGADLSSFYKTFADGCGMQFQLNYFQGLTKDMTVHPDRHLTADVSYLDLKNEYDRLMREDPAFAKAMSEKAAPRKGDDGVAQFKLFTDLWQKGTEDQKRLLGLMCRGFLSWSFSKAQKPQPMDKLILEYRNRRLAQTIVSEPVDKIWITYGANHLPGVIDELKRLDPNWRVETIKWSRTMMNPEDHKGELR